MLSTILQAYVKIMYCVQIFAVFSVQHTLRTSLDVASNKFSSHQYDIILLQHLAKLFSCL